MHSLRVLRLRNPSGSVESDWRATAPRENQAHADVFVVIRDAFHAMDRRLKGLSHRRRGAVKHHDAPAR
jgi:hypothetical protein